MDYTCGKSYFKDTDKHTYKRRLERQKEIYTQNKFADKKTHTQIHPEKKYWFLFLLAVRFFWLSTQLTAQNTHIHKFIPKKILVTFPLGDSFLLAYHTANSSQETRKTSLFFSLLNEQVFVMDDLHCLVSSAAFPRQEHCHHITTEH